MGKDILFSTTICAALLITSATSTESVLGSSSPGTIAASGTIRVFLPAIGNGTQFVDDLVFSSDRAGGSGIYRMRADGTNVRRLSPPGVSDWSPVWSPDKSAIAFSSMRSSTQSIYVMDADGNNVTQILSGGGRPQWSPDGQTLWLMQGDQGVSRIFSVSRNGLQRTLHIPSGQNDLHQMCPHPSPDGSRIVFVAGDNSTYSDIFTVHRDSTNTMRLTSQIGFAGCPQWSPRGDKIAYTQNGSTGSAQIWVMNADGSGKVRLSNNSASEFNPSWSRDGRKLYFNSDLDGDFDIYSIELATLQRTRIAASGSQENGPDQ